MELTQRFRRQVAPYDVVASLRFVAGTNYCPAIQTVKTNGDYDIYRSTAPTVIVADIVATAVDNSGSVDSVLSSQITDIEWWVQKGSETAGQNIVSHPDWTSNDYVIGTGTEKGRLTIKKDVPVGTTWKIWLKCKINDTRRGFSQPVVVITDSVMLFSVANAEDQYVMSIDRPSAEIYEPILDKKLLHEYKVSIGEDSTFVDDGNTHIRVIHVKLKQGKDILTGDTDYTIKIFKVNSGGRTEITALSENCLQSITGDEVVFNLLFAEKANYQIACFVGTKEVAHKTYSWEWSSEMPTTDEGIVGGATFSDGKLQSFTVKLNLKGSVIEHPCVALALNWYYRKNNVDTYVGSGEVQGYDLTKTSMFNTNTNEGEPVLKLTKKGAYIPVKNGSNRYTDGNGNYYIESPANLI